MSQKYQFHKVTDPQQVEAVYKGNIFLGYIYLYGHISKYQFVPYQKSFTEGSDFYDNLDDLKKTLFSEK